ncbi:conserved exported hypothetical protein [Burkholderiales bacterium 8X]|nr:conserved exported hypothetical protein [Burkholderiales bacterium 8X]
MKQAIIRAGLAAGIASLGFAASAKLPVTPETQAKAAEATAKLAWSGKVDGYQLCQAQDRVASQYRSKAAAEGKTVAPAPATPPCVDPGPFVFTPAAPASPGAPEQPKPIEVSGAHSPADTAKSPPSTNAPAAAVNPTPNAGAATAPAPAPGAAPKQ